MKRNVPLHVRLSAQEYQALNSIAQNNGVGISEAARMLIHDRCQKESLLVGMIATSESHKEPEAQK